MQKENKNVKNSDALKGFLFRAYNARRYKNVGQALPDKKQNLIENNSCVVGPEQQLLRTSALLTKLSGQALTYREGSPSPLVGEGALRAGEGFSRAFTLIELLVVGLIIGILAAVALPQYQIAVGKARMIEGITLCNSLAKAQQIYFLANGDYSHSLADIDIEMPTGGTMNTQKNRIEYPHFTLTMEGEKNNDWYCGVVSKSANIKYYHYWRPSAFFFQTDCRAPAEDKISTSICKNLGGKYKGSWNGSDGKQWKSYVILENK